MIVYRTPSGAYVDPHGKPVEGPSTASGRTPAQAAKAEAKGEAEDLPSLSGLKTAELEAVAEAEGIDISGAANNDERRSLIEKARKG